MTKLPQPPKLGPRVGGKLAFAAGNTLAAHRQVGLPEVGSLQHMESLRQGALNSKSSNRPLRVGIPYEDILRREGLLTIDDGAERQDLTHLMSVGESMLAFVVKSNYRKLSHAFLQSARVIVLPYGYHYEEGSVPEHPVATLLDVRFLEGNTTRTLKSSIGRGQTQDPLMDDGHLEVEIHTDGLFSVTDQASLSNSLYGAMILSEYDLNGGPQSMPPEAAEPTLRLLGHLRQKPDLWMPDLAELRPMPIYL